MKRMNKLLAFFLSSFLLLSAAGCSAADGKPEAPEPPEVTADIEKAPAEPQATEKPEIRVNIDQTPAAKLAERLVPYEDPNGCFTALVPEGWQVSTAGYDMYYWIRIFDPANLNLQVFTLLKAECLLADQSSKDFYEAQRGFELYTMFADMIVAGSVQEFYESFMDFCSFMAMYEPTYSGFEYPQISSFNVLESLPYASCMADACFDNAVLHASYTNTLSQEQGEGLFTGSMCLGADLGMARINSMYNVNAVTAPYGQLGEYEEILTEILSSVEYTDDFVSAVMTDQQIKAAGNAAIAQTLRETSDIVASGWHERQKTYDIISEQYSDATLGYERVYDVETGEVYRAYNGFTDIPGIDAYYQPITDEMYSDPIVGYIEK